MRARQSQSAPASPVGAGASPGRSVVDVRTLGATGDGRTLDTAALQRAIDEAAATGGVVRVGPGTYLTGTLELRSGIALDLLAGATLLGSPNLAHYRRGHWPALLLGAGLHDVAITGDGTLDGNSPALVDEFARIQRERAELEFFPGLRPGDTLEVPSPFGIPMRVDPYRLLAEGKLVELVYGTHERPFEFLRPQVVELSRCRNVTVSGITLARSACWVQTYRDCEDLRFERVTVRSSEYWNNDGIDLVDCRRVEMSDCEIDSADDALCLKSEPGNGGCADIHVARCRLRSGASALKLGTASHVGFRRIHVTDLDVADTYRSAVAIQSVDGAVIDDVVVERLRARNTGNAFSIRLGHRWQQRPPGVVRNVVLRDLDVEVPPLPVAAPGETGRPHNLIPSSIVGIVGHPVEGVLVENVRLRHGGGADRSRAHVPIDSLDAVPEHERDYPEYDMWGELPAWGAYLRHARGVTLRAVRLALVDPDFRPAIVADDAPGLVLDGVEIGAGGGEPVVVFKDSPGARLDGSTLPAGTREALRRIPPTG